MANFFYYDTNGTKQGLITSQELQDLVTQGIITPETLLETDTGHKGKAGQIKGLQFPELMPRETPDLDMTDMFTVPTPQYTSPQVRPANDTFCTNCGKPVMEKAVACMSCGAKPTGHKNFCRSCGVSVNPHQVMCIKCGAAVGKSRGGGSGNDVLGERNQFIAAALAFFFGYLGAHWLYLGNKKQGFIYLAICGFGGLLTLGIACIVMWLVGCFDAGRLAFSSEEVFREKFVAVE
jgi:hypothetical protein